LIDYLLSKAGYMARQAVLVNDETNHQWAEVYNNGTWWIVDPWWIWNFNNGNLVEIHDLANFSPFQNPSRMDVLLPNGTWVDASQEYGL
jgi:hypothetical protein